LIRINSAMKTPLRPWCGGPSACSVNAVRLSRNRLMKINVRAPQTDRLAFRSHGLCPVRCMIRGGSFSKYGRRQFAQDRRI